MTHRELLKHLRVMARGGCPMRPSSPYGFLQPDDPKAQEIARAAITALTKREEKPRCLS